ncbi:hypothetical protein K505DRAFT_371428 [Melanomma pulvis-pyrius CBS 109.77]|uniref:Mid2 domain-containing protein n=1 Tax=Melanomma pulvis-pyrius CBS 109.77 TaxID=1314802 RepID=A0A6A6XRG7_9PLEO|nr:hypothetical protein K505DRAFT_371428 [Melanomma pulvis-pyrius CBS 109.77]
MERHTVDLASLLPNQNRSTSCYSLSGLLSPYDLYTYIPCNLTAIANGQHSACCAPGDKCLANGLCEYGGPNPNHANEFWRIGCTDKTHADPACPTYCKDVEPDDPHLPNHLVFQCPGAGKWCCATGYLEDYEERGTLNTTCCGIPDLAFDIEGDSGSVYATATIRLDLENLATATNEAPASVTAVDATGGSQLSASASTTEASTGAGSAVATASPLSPTANANTNDGPTNAVALGVGFGLGIPVAVLAVIGLVALFLLIRRARRERELEAVGAESQEDLRRTHPHAFYSEIPSMEKAAEMDGRRSPVEAWTPMVKDRFTGRYG